MAASRARTAGETLELTERDLPIGIVARRHRSRRSPPIAWLLWNFSAGGPVHDHPFAVIAGTLLYHRSSSAC